MLAVLVLVLALVAVPAVLAHLRLQRSKARHARQVVTLSAPACRLSCSHACMHAHGVGVLAC